MAGGGQPDRSLSLERLRRVVKDGGGPKDVAARANIPLGSLNHYLGGREMRVEALIGVAAACNVSIEYLATGKDTPVGPPNFTILQTEVLRSKAHFWGLLVLLRSCQEYNEGMGISPSLADVLEWIGPPYLKARELPDRKIEFGSPAEGRM